MPPQSRAQRRRQTARQQQQRRPNPVAPSAEAVRETATTGPTVVLDSAPAVPAAPVRAASRNQRRVLSRAAPEPVDYSADYAAVRRDLRWIALWTVLLFGAMIVLSFSGLV